MTTVENTATPASTFESRAARIDAAQRVVAKLDAEPRAAADELVAAVEAHHAAVLLLSFVSLLRADGRGRELLYEAVDDPEVYAALELVRIDQGVAFVRLLGACQLCGPATQTLRDSVAEALLENLPEIIVIGQPGFDTAVEFPYRPQGARAFRFPYAITSSPAGSLFIADTSNNRIAIVDDAAAAFAVEPVGGSFDRVLGQRDTDANGENRWDRVEHDSLCWPYGLSYHGGRLAIADSGNNRVTVWGVEP